MSIICGSSSAAEPRIDDAAFAADDRIAVEIMDGLYARVNRYLDRKCSISGPDFIDVEEQLAG